MVGRSVRGDGPPVRQQLTGVFEDHDSVAEQGPPLLRVTRDRVCRLAVRCRSIRTRRKVRAHVSASWLSSASTAFRHLALWSRSAMSRASNPTKWPRPLHLTLPRRVGKCKRLAGALSIDFPIIDTATHAGWFRPTATEPASAGTVLDHTERARPAAPGGYPLTNHKRAGKRLVATRKAEISVSGLLPGFSGNSQRGVRQRERAALRGCG